MNLETMGAAGLGQASQQIASSSRDGNELIHPSNSAGQAAVITSMSNI